MSDEERFDAIIVGAGPAGSTAAYVMANAGLSVLLVERGDFPGAKNVTGGRLYTHSLEKIIPGFASEAPLGRKITKEKLTMMTGREASTLEYTSGSEREAKAESYSVLRSEFDRWLGEKAEQAGAMLACGIKVDDISLRDGKVSGVIAGGDEIAADVVILAEGTIAPLAQKLGMKPVLTQHQVAVGAKEVLALPPLVIEDRFGVQPGEGAAWVFAGSVSDGQPGGGFLYTNRDSISLGIVFTLAGINKTQMSVPQMVDEFKAHPLIAPLVKDAQLVEYSAHLVPEAGLNMAPQLYKAGALLVGDTAGFAINTGYVVRGIDLAIASGEAAAQTVISAKEKGDFSATGLAHYRSLLDESIVMHDLKQTRNFPEFMENTRIFRQYPEMLNGIMSDLFTIDGSLKPGLVKMITGRLKHAGYGSIIRDAWKARKLL